MRGYPALYDHGQQHLEACLPIDRVRHVRRHDDALAGGDEVRLAVDGEAARAVEHGDERVAVGGVRADLLILLEGEERHAQGAVLRERLAHDLPLLVFDLVAEAQHLCFFNVFQTHDPISFVLDC